MLRAAAVLLVLGHHGGYAGETLPPALGFPFRVWNRSGWIGVDLFFVLSGFLVSGLLFRECRRYGRVAAGRFLGRRGLKIYPAFYVYLAAVIVTRVLVGAAVPRATVLSEALFVQNYGGRFLIHTWSLAVEEHFYLLLTALFALGASAMMSARRVVIGVAVLAVVVLIARCAWWAAGGSSESLLYATHFRADALAGGVALAAVYHLDEAAFQRFAGKRAVLLFASGAGLLPALVWRNTHPFMLTVGLTTTFVGFSALLAVVVGHFRHTRVPPLAAPLAWIGMYSYSIYLWHLPVRVALLWIGRRGYPIASRGLTGFTAFVVLSLGVGWLLARLVEMPGLYVRERWLPSRTGAATTRQPVRSTSAP